MTPGAFLREILPTAGYYCIAEQKNRPNGKPGDKYWKHHVYPTIGEAVTQANFLASSTDVYFAVMSLAEAGIKDYSKPDEYRQLDHKIKTRVKENMLCSRALFLDLDVGSETNKYPSQADALADIERFCFQTGLPLPMLVSSGGGVHCYWRLDRDVSVKDWLPMAGALRGICKAIGLRYDPTRTIDTTSVLRVVGTFNRKRVPPRPVEVLHRSEPLSVDRVTTQLNALAARYQADTTIQPHKSYIQRVPGLPEQKILSDFTPETLADVVKSCGQVLEVVRSYVDPTHPHYGDLDNPGWYRVAVGVIGHVKGGPDIVRDLTSKHPRSNSDVEVKLEQALLRGPTKCQTIAENVPWGDGPCKTCPGRLIGQNPLMVARKSVSKPVTADAVAQVLPPPPPAFQPRLVGAPPPPPPPPGSPPPPPPPPPPSTGGLPLPAVGMPPGYVRTADGIIYAITLNEDGDEERELVLPWSMYPVSVQCNHDRSGYASDWVSLARDDKGRLLHPVIINIPNVMILDEREMKRILLDRGVNIPLDFWKDAMRYMSAYVAHMQRGADTDIKRDSLGWADDAKVFVMPDESYHADGRVTPSNFQQGEISRMLQPAGDLQTQIRALDFYLLDPASAPHQAILAAALGSILIKPTGQVGYLLALVGDSGVAKSTLLNTCASLWGKFDTYVLNGTQGGATKNYMAGRTQVLSNLPTGIDEITHLEPEDAATLSMRSSQATGRGRLNSDGSEKRAVGEDRSSVIITTSNRSMYELLAADHAARTAGHMRVIEFEMTPPALRGGEARAMMGTLEHNYGHIGRAFAKFVVCNYAACSQLVQKIMVAIEREIGADNSERFRVVHIATTLAAAEISRAIGLLQFDVDAIHEWEVNQLLPAMRRSVDQAVSQPSDVLSGLLRRMNGSIALTDGAERLLDLPQRGEVMGLYDKRVSRLYIPVAVVKDHLRITKLSRSVLDTALANMPGLLIGEADVPIPAQGGLASRAICYVFDANHRFLKHNAPQLGLVQGGAGAATA